MDASIGKFFLDVLKQLQDVFAKAADRKSNLIAVGTLLQLYGSSTRLAGYARNVRVAPKPTTARLKGHPILDFFAEVHEFGRILRQANISAIELYHPELARELASVVGMDASLQATFRHDTAPRFQIETSELKALVDLYVENYEVSDGAAWKVEKAAGIDWWGIRGSKQYDALWDHFADVETRLNEFRNILGEVVRETWDFKELATHPATHS